MDILALDEGGYQLGVLGEVCQGAQVYLGVVGGEEQGGLLLSDKGFSHLPAFLGANRDVLQIGVARGEPAGDGARLVEAGVYPAGIGVDQGRKGIDIG